MLSSALTAGVGLATLIIHRIKCAYRRSDEGECLPSCACQEKPLEEESELTVHRVTLNGLELIYAARKRVARRRRTLPAPVQPPAPGGARSPLS